jgi:NAD(P)-dependent dehydrogenase (short-subunit alcohol dehydrogenase family)
VGEDRDGRGRPGHRRLQRRRHRRAGADGRFALPGDVAAAVAFLADPARSGYINGVVLPVDGGWTADAGWTALRLRKR